tara:strand:+ start:259 stop:777 length:519 start_codon:yes stop_codon:yes gene_type:complete
MKKIKIQDKELFISNFQLKDINSNYIKWLNNKELLKFSSNKFVNFDKKKCIKFFKSFQNSQNLFLSIKNNNLELIGTLTCYFFCNKKICDIGILLGDRKYRSKGLGLKAWKMTMDYLIKNYNLKKISAGTLRKNTKMLNIFKKSGMIYDGYRKQNFYDKNFFDIVFYAKYLN